MSPTLALAVGALLAAVPRCEPRAEAPPAPPPAVFAVLGGGALDGLEACPAGSVPPHPRPVAAETLPARPGAPQGEDGCQAHGCWAWAGWNDRREMRGAGARLSVEAPATIAPDHSLAEVALHWGADERDIVEVGWEVAPRRYGDAAPHLFVHRWIDGRPCDGDCAFVRWSPRLVPGMSLAAWTGKPVAMGWLLWEGRAWAWVDGEWLGTFDLGPHAPRTASVAQWFGEIFFVRSPPAVAMGNGRSADRRDAARFDRVCDVPADAPSCLVRSARFPRVTEPERFPLRVAGPGAFRYGGAGELGLPPPGDGGTGLRPRPPPSSASGETPPARGTSAPSRPR